MIETYKRFKDAQLIVVNETNIKEIIMNQDKKLLWRNIRILRLERNTLAVPLIHILLEEVEITMQDEFPVDLLHEIKNCTKLKKLNLKAKRFVNKEGDETTADWSFLKAMPCLKEFHLVHPRTQYNNWESGNGKRLLESLPLTQLERLTLRGIGSAHNGFWSLCGKQPDLEDKLNLFRGLRNLKFLSFRYCFDSVDDEVMQVINKEMTSLEVLELSHCSNLTDRGFTGQLEDHSDSIQNLRGNWK